MWRFSKSFGEHDGRACQPLKTVTDNSLRPVPNAATSGTGRMRSTCSTTATFVASLPRGLKSKAIQALAKERLGQDVSLKMCQRANRKVETDSGSKQMTDNYALVQAFVDQVPNRMLCTVLTDNNVQFMSVFRC